MLQINAQFTIVLLMVDQHSLAFENWCKTIFFIQNPDIKDDFEFSRFKLDDEPEDMEITAHNPMFSVDSLYELFRASYKENDKEQVIEKTYTNLN